MSTKKRHIQRQKDTKKAEKRGEKDREKVEKERLEVLPGESQHSRRKCSEDS